ncbi:MAG TPA: lysophospholipid acyltransferase family protein [Bryobacteraceae bacterium]|jgi:1-acyl-sn-glycerol-3-phosphate acyltransferase|nr:lysophospholipid acyltransferase family protein [Bryobacteraceae bacterium]
MNDAATRRNPSLPPVAKRLLEWFHRYARWYLARNFHGLHLLRLSDVTAVENLPLLVCLNHPSWWDPLVGLHLSQRVFPQRAHFAPIDAAGLAKYKFLERLGFFGVERGTRRGAARFLEIGEAVLKRADAALWVTPQGEFTDVRVPVKLKPGIGHLANRLDRFALLPVALEYGFWNERYPEAFVCIGRPLIEDGRTRNAAQWTDVFESSLQETLTALSSRVVQRKTELFEQLLEGKAGVGGIYDLWRASKARLQGKRWQPEHSGD